MTREQARREIDSLDYYLQNHTDDYGEESHTAMMMAKDALSSSENPNTCGDAISRKHLLEEIALLKKSPWFNENTYGSKVIRKEAVEIVEDVCIKREPSVTPQQRTGRWIKQNYGWNWQCSECVFVTPPSAKEIFTFCPNCGTKMEVEK